MTITPPYKLVLFLFFFCIKIAVFAQPPFEDFDTYIEKGMKTWQIPGMSVAVVKNHQIVYAKGYGVKEIGKSDKVDTETLFGIGSNTKAFTAAALAKLEFDRKLKLNDKVIQYFPRFQMQDSIAGRLITIRDLLCHRTGLGTWEGDFTHWGSRYSKEELIDKIRFLPPSFSLREAFGYGNVTYMLAGEVIPRVTKGIEWKRYLQDNFFAPLDMQRTCTSTNDLKTAGNVATPHTLWKNELTPLPWRNLDNLDACGSLNSTATDMAHWLVMQMDSGRYEGRQILPWIVVRNSHIPQITLNVEPYNNPYFPSSHFLGYGLGWFVRDYYGKMLIFHTGSIDGMESMTAFFPEEKTGIVILTNSDAHNFSSALMYQFADKLLNAPRKDWQAHFFLSYLEEVQERKDAEPAQDLSHKPDLPFSNFEGHYYHTHYGQITLRYQNHELIAYPSAHPQTTGKLIPWGGNTFICEWTDKAWDRSFLQFTLENQKVIDFSMTTRPNLLDPAV